MFQAKELVAEPLLVQEGFFRALENDPAVFDDIGVLDEFQRSVDVLLGQRQHVGFFDFYLFDPLMMFTPQETENANLADEFRTQQSARHEAANKQHHSENSDLQERQIDDEDLVERPQDQDADRRAP